MNTTIIISLGITLVFCALIYFFLRKRIDSVDKKVNILMQLVKEHHQQVQQQSHIIMREKAETPQQNLIQVSDDEEDNKEEENYTSDDSCEISDTESIENDGGRLSQFDDGKNITLDNISLLGAETTKEQNKLRSFNEVDLKFEEITTKDDTKDNLTSNLISENDHNDEISLDEIVIDDNQTDNEDDDEDDDEDETEDNSIKPINLVEEEVNIDISKLKVSELKNKAKEMGLEGYSNLKKKQLVNLITSKKITMVNDV